MGDFLEEIQWNTNRRPMKKTPWKVVSSDTHLFENFMWFDTPEEEQLQPTPRKDPRTRVTPQIDNLTQDKQDLIRKNFG